MTPFLIGMEKQAMNFHDGLAGRALAKPLLTIVMPTIFQSPEDNMASNSFGTLLRCTTFGESHGPTIGVVIDGCPAGVHLTEDMINEQLARRAPGQTPYTSPRREKDRGRLVSGVFEETTTGAPITILIDNHDADSGKYTSISHLCRPGHANTTYLAKYGIFDYRGGGRASARETAARVAAGAVAKALLSQSGIGIFAFLSQVGPHTALELDNFLFNDMGNISEANLATIRQYLKKSRIFAPTPEAEGLFTSAIAETMKQRNSLGGIVRFFITGVPQGLGDPVYDKLSAQLAFALMSIPASKGFEIGQGFASASYTGFQYNDHFTCQERDCNNISDTTQPPSQKTHYSDTPQTAKCCKEISGPAQPPSASDTLKDKANPKTGPLPGNEEIPLEEANAPHWKEAGCATAPTIHLGSNRAGGILGGISTGDTIYGSVAFKPTPSIGIPQLTLTLDGEQTVFILPKGSRHDPCLAVRAVPVVEAMCWLVMAEAWLKNHVASMNSLVQAVPFAQTSRLDKTPLLDKTSPPAKAPLGETVSQEDQTPACSADSPLHEDS